MRRAQIQQVHLAAANLDGEPVVEGLVGIAQRDAAEVEGPEPFSQISGRNGTEVGGLGHHQHLGSHAVGDLLGGALGGDHPHRAVQQLVAVGVVAVGVGDQRVGDRRAVGDGRHRGQHFAGQRQVEQGVDQQ